MFGNLLLLVFGGNHPLTQAYSQFWHRLDAELKLQLQDMIDRKKLYKPAHILRRVQLEIFQWLNSVRFNRVPLPLSLDQFWSSIMLSEWREPRLPKPLWDMVREKPIDSNRTQTTGSSSSTATSISGLTNPTGLATQPAADNTAVLNPQPDPAIQKLVPAGMKLQQVTKTAKSPVPKNSTDGNMCLSYHVRGRCFSRCRRSADHRKHSDEEKSVMSAWLIENVPLAPRD